MQLDWKVHIGGDKMNKEKKNVSLKVKLQVSYVICLFWYLYQE